MIALTKQKCHVLVRRIVVLLIYFIILCISNGLRCRSLTRSFAHSFVRSAASLLANATALSLYPFYAHIYTHAYIYTLYRYISVVLFHRSTSISIDITKKMEIFRCSHILHTHTHTHNHHIVQYFKMRYRFFHFVHIDILSGMTCRV